MNEAVLAPTRPWRPRLTTALRAIIHPPFCPDKAWLRTVLIQHHTATMPERRYMAIHPGEPGLVNTAAIGRGDSNRVPGQSSAEHRKPITPMPTRDPPDATPKDEFVQHYLLKYVANDRQELHGSADSMTSTNSITAHSGDGLSTIAPATP